MAIDERELDDASLVSAAQAGDDTAFAELFRRHYLSVRRACTRRLGSAVDADEVAQAAFVRAYERIDQCAGERRFGAWVQVIAYNIGADARRTHARSTPMDEPLFGDAALGPNHCEEHVLRAEQAAAVQEVLATLPPRQREVIVARDVEGRRPGEIAASLGLTVGAVDSLLLRARRRMVILWQNGAAERGAVSTPVTTASIAATTAVYHRTTLARMATVFHKTVRQASYNVASSLGIVPSRQTGVARAAGVAAIGMMAVVPAAAAQSPHPWVTTPSAGTTTTTTRRAAHLTPAVPLVQVVEALLQPKRPETVPALEHVLKPAPNVSKLLPTQHVVVAPPAELTTLTHKLTHSLVTLLGGHARS